MQGVDAVLIEVIDILPPYRKCAKRAVALDNPLWFSRGSRGIDHIGPVLRRRPVDRFRILIFRKDTPDQLLCQDNLCF